MHWDSNLVRYNASKPEAMPFANQENIFDDPGILLREECSVNRAPKSLVRSTGLES